MEEVGEVNFLETVEEIVVDFGDICRFCLTKTKSNISVLDTCSLDNESDCEETSILDFVSKITSIKVRLY